MSQNVNEPHLTGLTDQEVLTSRQQHGENLLTPPKRPSIWKLYGKISGSCNPSSISSRRILLIISIIENEYAETIGIFFAIFWLPESDSILNMMPTKI